MSFSNSRVANSAPASHPVADASRGPSQGLRWFSKLLALCVVGLIFLGGHVKSNEAGLAVPDWPTSFGYNMFTFPVSYWVGGIFHEHVHRLVASFVGILTVILTVWTLFGERRRWVRGLTAVALGAVMLQGLLGGLTVHYQLPVWTSSMHGTLGQIFLCIVVALAYCHSNEWYRAVLGGSRVVPNSALATFRLAARLLVGVIVAQLIFGNLMRHSEAGLAVPDFPTMAGSYLPSTSPETLGVINALRTERGLAPVDKNQVLLHLVHRLWAVAVMVAVLWAALTLRRLGQVPGQIKHTMRGLEILLVIQIALGIWVILSVRSPIIATVHVLVGALMLAGAVLLNLRSLRLLRSSEIT
ncbi:MAG: hypothetical protein EBZ48_08480 [Proteobacteria bacterium]|nr:hypothetical protein [Pseudomonadota bacterium]